MYQLPYELVLKIMLNLDIIDIYNFSNTCKNYNKIYEKEESLFLKKIGCPMHIDYQARYNLIFSFRTEKCQHLLHPVLGVSSELVKPYSFKELLIKQVFLDKQETKIFTFLKTLEKDFSFIEKLYIVDDSREEENLVYHYFDITWYLNKVRFDKTIAYYNDDYDCLTDFFICNLHKMTKITSISYNVNDFNGNSCEHLNFKFFPKTLKEICFSDATDLVNDYCDIDTVTINNIFYGNADKINLANLKCKEIIFENTDLDVEDDGHFEQLAEIISLLKNYNYSIKENGDVYFTRK